MIAARNEEVDLPATIASLKMGREAIRLIVVVNGSSDNTAQIAHDMGAEVIDLPDGAKMGALQAGVEAAISDGSGTVLFTDADTIVGPHWAANLADSIRAKDLAITSSDVWRWHGPSKAADAAKVAKCLITYRAARKGKDKLPLSGPNMGLRFTPQLAQVYGEINKKLFFGEEAYIRDMVEALGGQSIWVANAPVVSRGDRNLSLLYFVRQRRDPKLKQSVYDHDVPDRVPYNKVEGFHWQHQRVAVPAHNTRP